MRLVVISDIHVGSGPLDDCDAELEAGLVAFIEELAAGAEPTTLVINGDFLDFAQAEPSRSKELEAESADGIPLCFTEEQSVAKLDGIVRAHRPIFEALGRIAGGGGEHRVVILPGNHDADFFGPASAQSSRQLSRPAAAAARIGCGFIWSRAIDPSIFRGFGSSTATSATNAIISGRGIGIIGRRARRRYFPTRTGRHGSSNVSAPAS